MGGVGSEAIPGGKSHCDWREYTPDVMSLNIEFLYSAKRGG